MALVFLALGVSLAPRAAQSSRFPLVLFKAAAALVSRCASPDGHGCRWWSTFELTADDARRGEAAVEEQAAHAHRAEHATSTAFSSLERRWNSSS